MADIYTKSGKLDKRTKEYKLEQERKEREWRRGWRISKEKALRALLDKSRRFYIYTGVTCWCIIAVFFLPINNSLLYYIIIPVLAIVAYIFVHIFNNVSCARNKKIAEEKYTPYTPPTTTQRIAAEILAILISPIMMFRSLYLILTDK